MKKFKWFNPQKLVYLIGIIIFIFILYRIDLSKILRIFKEADVILILIAACFIIPINLLKSYKWRYILKLQGIHFSLWDSFLMYSNGLFAGILTPGRIGDFVKVFYLKKKGFSFRKSFFTIIVDRCSDIFFLLVFGYISVLALLYHFNYEILFYSLLIIAVVFAFFAILLYNYLFKKILKFVFKVFIPKRFKLNIRDTYLGFLKDARMMSFSSYLNILYLTGFSWLLYYVPTYILAKSIGIVIPFFYIASIITIAYTVSLIPITISGIGTRDATFIFMFSFFNYSSELAIAFSILILGITVFVAFVGMITWFIRPIPLNLKEEIINTKKEY